MIYNADHLPIDAATGLRVQQIEVSCFDDEDESGLLPEGWLVAWSVDEGRDSSTQKWHEHSERRFIGPERDVWAAWAARAGVTLTLES